MVPYGKCTCGLGHIALTLKTVHENAGHLTANSAESRYNVVSRIGTETKGL